LAILTANLQRRHEDCLAKWQFWVTNVESRQTKRDVGCLAFLPGFGRRHLMNKDRVEGSLKQAKGSVKDATGKVLGDVKLQAEGKADKAEGKLQNAVGGLKDKAKN
jgi:uncharacterized protein YjbJ (UPF0337 family)